MTLFEKLQNASLPVISATDNGAVTMQPLTPEQEIIFQDILLEHLNPTAYADLQSQRADLQQFKTEYLNTITTLQNIEDAQSPTNAQVIDAIKFIAKTLKLLLRLLVKSFV